MHIDALSEVLTNLVVDAVLLTSQYNGTNRARTYDPLLVRQMLSQLSYDPMRY